jgi:hypothetical protein
MVAHLPSVSPVGKSRRGMAYAMWSTSNLFRPRHIFLHMKLSPPLLYDLSEKMVAIIETAIAVQRF